MSYTSTTNLNLRKDNGDEKIVDIRPHLNTNLDTIDQAYGELDSRCRGQQTWGNLKSTSTWGELKGNGVTTPSSQTTNLELIKPGYDSNVDVEVFNDNMDAIDSAIGPLPSNKTLQGQISTLQDSVDKGSIIAIRRGANKRYVTFTSSRGANHYGTIFITSSYNGLVALVVVNGESYSLNVIHSNNNFAPTITDTSTSIRIDLGNQWAHSAFVLGGSMADAVMSVADG